VGIPFEERWKRLDEVIQTLRALWNQEDAVFKGNFYNTEGIALEPYPAQKSGPPLWVGSWGSKAGLQRVARLADGWLASGYNTTPELFAAAWQQLQEFLLAAGKDPASFPNALASTWMYVTESERESERMLQEVLAPVLNRPVTELRERLPIGSPQACAEKLAAYQKVGVQRIYLWPLANDLDQIKIFMNEVVPLINAKREQS
jgi:alkanesulfonate monooxygenase SsuD/methylene tetrahydromethanopterin reductase-like flavin-dependent oxidoreductase (luciferase family)